MRLKKVDPAIEACLDLSGRCIRLPETADFAAQRAEWQALWEQHMEGSKREATSLDLAEMLVRLGAYIAMQRREYQTAYDDIAAFLRHLQAAQLEYTYRSWLSGDQFACLLHLDRQEQALQLAARMLEAERRSDVRTSESTLLGNLFTFGYAQDENASVPEPLAALTHAMMEQRVGKKLKPLPSPIQYGVLLAWMNAVLDETREREERARQRRLQRDAARAETKPSLE